MGEFKHKHSLGQNFLKDKNVLLRIVDSVDIKEDDLILEIGPGQGALTKYLKLFQANLICFEIDHRVRKYLDSFVDEKTKILYKDFMQVDLEEELKDFCYKDIYVVSNLPYYITSPIIEKLTNSTIFIKGMVLMVQNEVADRLSAKPGSKEYGVSSVLLGYDYTIEKLFFVPRASFSPAPNVDSAVIKLEKRESVLSLRDKEFFSKFVKDAFLMKRKNLKNNLKRYDLEKIEQVLKSYELTLQDRAENVPMECFVEIVNTLNISNA